MISFFTERMHLLNAASITDVLDNADQLSVSSDATEQPTPSWDERDGCGTEDDDNEQMKKPVLRFVLSSIASSI